MVMPAASFLRIYKENWWRRQPERPDQAISENKKGASRPFFIAVKKRLLGGDHRQQNIGHLAGGKVQCVFAAKDFRRPVLWVGVGKWTNTFHRIGRMRDTRISAVELVILAAHGEGDAIAFGHHNRRRPDFHIEIDRRARCQRLDFIVGV